MRTAGTDSSAVDGPWGGRPIVPVVLGQGTRLFPDSGPDMAPDLVDSRADSKGVTIQLYRPAERPQYATD
jgi:hypothetical protein